MFLSLKVMILLFAATLCKAQIKQQWQTKQQSNQGAMQQCSTTALAKSVDNFSASLIKAIGEKGNFFASPLSIFSAVSMTYLGAGGQTAEQIKDAFQLKDNGLDKDKLNEAYERYIDMVEAGNDEYSLFIANGLFVQRTFDILFSYIKDVRSYYHGSVKTEDFENNGDAAKEDINQFVAENTRNMIQKLFEEPLNPQTVLVIVNAIYFKGTWKTQFPKDETRDGVFYKTDRSTKTVKFMRLTKATFRYFEDLNSGYQYLELPYQGGSISMVIALPRDPAEVPDLDLTSNRLCSINGSLRSTEIANIEIPKFRLEYEKELKDGLEKLGIKDLFTDSADLSDILVSGGIIKVSSVLHKAVIEVNEEGSEAAAVTGVVVVTTSINLNPITFKANHPFSFYIIDNRNGLVLFSARVSDI